MIRFNLHVVMAQKGRITQRKLSELSGVSVSAINRIYNETAERIDRNTLDALCKALNCQVQDLLEYVPDPDTESGSE